MTIKIKQKVTMEKMTISHDEQEEKEEEEEEKEEEAG